MCLSFLGLQLLGPLLNARTGIEYLDLPPVPARDSLSLPNPVSHILQQCPSLISSVSCILHLASISLHKTANTSYYRTAANAFCSHPTRDPSHYRRIGTCSPNSIPALTTIRGASTLLISSSLAFFTRRSSPWPHHWTTRHSSSTCTEGLCQPTLPPWTI